MAENQKTWIDARLMEMLRHIARQQGRSETDLVNEAVYTYLGSLPNSEQLSKRDEVDIGKEVTKEKVAPHEDAFAALLDRMSSRFDMDEDEAMKMAVEEQKAFRREHSRSERAGR